MGFFKNQILSSPSLINLDTCFRIIRYENTHTFIKSRYSKIENQKTLYIHKQTTKNASCNVSKYNNIFLKCYIQTLLISKNI